MKSVCIGDVISIKAIGKKADGAVMNGFEELTSKPFRVGFGPYFPAFDRAIVGMKPGDVKTETFCYEEAYGPRLPAYIFSVPVSELPPQLELHVGQEFELTDYPGGPLPIRVIEITDTEIYVDTNNPLAGHDLTYSIELLEILSSE